MTTKLADSKIRVNLDSLFSALSAQGYDAEALATARGEIKNTANLDHVACRLRDNGIMPCHALDAVTAFVGRFAKRAEPIGNLHANGQTLRVTINLRKLREGYATHDAGKLLMQLGKELAYGFDCVLTPECTATIYPDGSLLEG